MARAKNKSRLLFFAPMIIITQNINQWQLTFPNKICKLERFRQDGMFKITD